MPRTRQHATDEESKLAQVRKPSYAMVSIREAIKKAKGEQVIAAQILGCSRASVSMWLQKHPELRELQRRCQLEGDEERFAGALNTCDFLLASAMKKAKEGKASAIAPAERQTVRDFLTRTRAGRERFMNVEKLTLQPLLPSPVQHAPKEETPWLVEESDADAAKAVAAPAPLALKAG